MPVNHLKNDVLKCQVFKNMKLKIICTHLHFKDR